MTDAEKLDHVRQMIADEEQLEAHYRRTGENRDTFAQASAFNDIRRFLCTPEVHVPVPLKRRWPTD